MSIRPRPSVLAAFDPLTASDSEPPSDCQDQDPFATLFRAKPPTSHQPPTVKLGHRLVDIGDTTIEDGNLLTVQELDEDLTPTRNDQQPLRGSEIQSPAEHKRKFSPPREQLGNQKRRCIREKPEKMLQSSQSTTESGLSSIVKAVNSSGLSFASMPLHRPTVADLVGNVIPIVQQSIKCTSAEDVLSRPVVQPQGTSIVLSSPPAPSQYPALDLASFYNQIKLPDIDFDLIHDEISFSAEKWIIGGDKDDHIDSGKTDVIASAISPSNRVSPCRHFGFSTPHSSQSRFKLQDVDSASVQPSLKESCVSLQVEQVASLQAEDKTQMRSNVREILEPRSQSATVLSTVLNHEHPTAAQSLSRQDKEEVVTPLIQRPMQLRPPPVHALRIVKKAPRVNQEKPAETLAEPLAAHPAPSKAGGQTNVRDSSVSTSTSPNQATKITPHRAHQADKANTVSQPRNKQGISAIQPTVRTGAPVTTGNGPKRLLVAEPPAAPKLQKIVQIKDRLRQKALDQPRQSTKTESAINRNPTASRSTLPRLVVTSGSSRTQAPRLARSNPASSLAARRGLN